MGNHDNKRLASRFGVERTDLMNMLLQTLPGVAVTYNVNCQNFFVLPLYSILLNLPGGRARNDRCIHPVESDSRSCRL